MLVKKKVEMWDATQIENGNWILRDCNGAETEISDEEFHAVYEEVPSRHASRRQQSNTNSIQEALRNDGEVQGDSESA